MLENRKTTRKDFVKDFVLNIHFRVQPVTQCLSLSLGMANKIFKAVPQAINAGEYSKVLPEFAFQRTKRNNSAL